MFDDLGKVATFSRSQRLFHPLSKTENRQKWFIEAEKVSISQGKKGFIALQAALKLNNNKPLEEQLFNIKNIELLNLNSKARKLFFSKNIFLFFDF